MSLTRAFLPLDALGQTRLPICLTLGLRTGASKRKCQITTYDPVATEPDRTLACHSVRDSAQFWQLV
jgi:hypothetical protein